MNRMDQFVQIPYAPPSPNKHTEERFLIKPGTIRDYDDLAHHHYKSGRPSAVTSVFIMLDTQHDDVIARFRQLNSQPTIKDDNHERPPHPTIGVLVRSLPRLSCQLREVATANRYRNFDAKSRARLLNREMRVISRVILDSRYRGLGLAVRLVRYALTHSETIYTEALAAMGRVNPFFERAGMRRYDRPHRAEHARLLDVMAEIGIDPSTLASRTRLNELLTRAGPAGRNWFEAELRRWVGSAFRMSKQAREKKSFDECLVAARDHLLSRCVYYLYRNEKDDSNDYESNMVR